ncbi:MAG: alpha-glucosidase/alpha-galactosidase [Rhodobacteraceae bacterium]|nr:alpha-glucosidase/alpha-galactosidase [Paracoccaceae bacterium]
MMVNPKIAFIGAGSTVFMKNIVGDILQRPALSGATIALMDIDAERLGEAEIVARKLVDTLDACAEITASECQREAVDGADFVICAFQIGGFHPATVTDFEIPKRFGLRQTIGDTLGVGGIMRGLRTVPHLWKLCDDITALCPGAILLQYVNPMAINCWAINARYPDIRCVGLCHSVQETINSLAWDLEIPVERMQFTCAGINHVAFFLTLEERLRDGRTEDLYPRLLAEYAAGRIPKPNREYPNCPNLIRYEVMRHLGYFVTESSEHFAEYVPWFIKNGHPELIDKFQIPLDEYVRRCEEQMATWQQISESFRKADRLEVSQSKEYAADIINSVWTGESSLIHGNVRNGHLIAALPKDCCVEVPCYVDGSGIHPIRQQSLPPQLTALMRTSVNVQELTVAALMHRNPAFVRHAALLDPHTAAELDPDQISNLIDALIAAHGDLLPSWLQAPASSNG